MTLARTLGTTVTGVTGNTATVALTSVPANSLVVLFCMADADNGNLTESLSIGTTGGLTWTKQGQSNGSPGAVAAVFTAPFAAGGSITVTVVDSDAMTDSASEIGVKPVFFTDSGGSIPGVGAITTTTVHPTTVTSTATGSWFWAGGLAGSTGYTTAQAGATLQFGDTSFDAGDTIAVWSLNALSTGSGQTLNLDYAAPPIHNVGIEIKPPTGGPTPISESETGSASDSEVVSATVPITETGSGSDASQVSANVPVTDSAAGADAAQVTATVPVTETGSASDAPQVHASLPVSESGTGTDAIAIAAVVHPAESGSANDAITASATVPLSDSGSGADTISVNTGATPISLADSGTASEAITEAVTAHLAETGAVVEALTISAHLNLAETGSAAETLTILVHAAATDSATALDSLGATATIHLAEAGTAADAFAGGPAGVTQKQLTDVGSACECLCVVLVRPNTGSISRPDTGTTTRPNTGPLGRPGTGVITRPNTGVVHAPGRCDCH